MSDKPRATSWILVVLILAVVAAGIFSFRQMQAPGSRSADESAGDQAAAEGNWSAAAQRYAQAASASDDPAPIRIKEAEALAKLTVSDSAEARNILQRRQDVYARIVDAQPDNAQAFDDWMRLFLHLARDAGDVGAWQLMHDQASAAASGANASAEVKTLGRKYRGIAMATRIRMGGSTTRVERQQAAEDLDAALAANPSDTLAAYYKQLLLLHQMRLEPDKQEDHRKAIASLAAKVIEAEPATARLVDQAHVSIELKELPIATQLVSRAEQSLLSEPAPIDVLRLVKLIPHLMIAQASSGEAAQTMPNAIVDSRQRVAALLERTAAEHPGNAAIRWAHAVALKDAGSTADAADAYAAFRTASLEAAPIFMLQVNDQRRTAGIAEVELRLAMANNMQVAAERSAAASKAEAVLRQIESTLPDAVQHLLRGKLATVRREWSEAARAFDRACEASNNTASDALQLSAQAHLKAGNTDSAIARYEQLVALAPDSAPVRLELARLHLQQRNLEKARKQVEEALRIAPASVAANAMLAQVLTESGQISKAIDLYTSLNPKANPQLVVPLATLYRQAGRSPEAIELLESRLEDAPTDLKVLQELVRLSTSRDQANAYIAQASEAGANTDVITQLERAVSGATEAPAIDQSIASGTSDPNNPFDRALNEFRSHHQAGQFEKAEQALALAASMKPEHAAVVDGQFQLALRNGDWDVASEKAKQAGKLNLDNAAGEFYTGRLQIARGNFQQAQATLRSALQKRDDYNLGWLWLGESQRQAGQFKQAIASYNRALKLVPDDVPSLSVLAAAYHSDGQHDRALSTFRKLAMLQPKNDALASRYLSYEQVYGEQQQVLNIRQQRANTNPDDFDNQRKLAMLYSEMEQHEQAKESIGKVLEQDGRSRSNLLVAAEVHRLAGDSETTRNLLQENLDRLGDDATAEDWLILGRYVRAISANNRQGLQQTLNIYRKARSVEGEKKPATRELAQLLFQLGVDDEAARLYETLDEQDLLDAEATFQYAQVLNRLERRDEARSLLADLPENIAGKAETHTLRGVIAMGDKQYEEAITHLDRAIAQQPNNVTAHTQRALAYYSLPDHEDQARKAVTRLLEIDPNNVTARQISGELYRKAGDLPRAIRDYERIHEALPDNKQVILTLADLYRQNQNEPARMALLEKGAKQFPNDPTFHAVLAGIQLESGDDREKAIEHIEQLVEQSPAAQNIATLAIQYLQVERAQDAVDLLAKHNDVVSQTPELLAVRGRALAAIDRDTEAADAFAEALAGCKTYQPFATVVSQMTRALGHERTQKRLVQLANSNGAIAGWANLSVAQIRIESGKTREGLNLLRMIDIEIASGTPARTVFNRLLAYAYNNLGEYDKARIALEEMLEEEPGNTWTANFLARLLIEHLDQPGRAVEVAEVGLATDPKDWRLLDAKGWAQIKLKQYDAAVDSLRRSLAIKQTAGGSLHMAQAYAGKRDVPNAKLMYNQAIQLAGLEDNAPVKAMATQELNRLR